MKSKKQMKADAEYEYYERDSRAHRWGVISHSVSKVSDMVRNYSRDYCDCQRCGHSRYTADYLKRYGEFPPEYEGKCARCSEERGKLRELIEELSQLETKTQEVYVQYDGERVSRPLHLP